MAYNNNNKNKKKPNRKGHKSSYQSNAPKKEEAVKEITYSDAITVGQLAQLLHKNSSEIIKFLFMMGNMSTINTVLSDEDIELICMNFNVEVHKEVVVDEDDIEEQLQNVEEDESKLVPRPPVVTIMGHVDHGKTTLLDTIRKANVTENEFGGITQHIGAYQVSLKGRKVTFLDTPGHEAFTAMRARGAEVTDIVIIVVAADDGVMPQTKEAVDHAKAAGVPIVVAVNKIDKPGANPDRIMSEMSELGIMPEEWGGDTIFTQVSAKKGTGVPELLETMLLVADMQELKANPDTNASGTVIEAKLDKGRGPVATLLVQRGTLHTGDSVVVGTSYGRVRKMTNDRGMEIKHAEPSCPVEIIGLNEVPRAGDVFMSYDSYKKAAEIAGHRLDKQIEKERNSTSAMSLEDLAKKIDEGDVQEINVLIKADVQGSVEALRQSLEGIKNPEVRIVIVHAAVGAINESDIMLASASNAIVMGFNVRPDANVRRAAEQEKVDLRTYRVIYDAINDVESAMRGMLAPQFKEVVVGRAEVRQVISTPKAIVAGSYVTEGRITNDSEVRLIRDGIVVFEGKVDSLRRFKDEVKEVKTSFECGISLEGYRDIKEGDVIEAYLMEEVAPQI